MAGHPALAARRTGTTSAVNAHFMLGAILLIAVGAFGCWLVGTRGQDIGSDTSTYATFFQYLGGSFETRLEPGFVFISYVLKRIGLDVIGYQIALFALLLAIVAVSARRYFDYLGGGRGFLTFLSAALMLEFLSPMFVNGSINAVRQGLAALLVFSALLSFQQRKWWLFALYGALASSLHASSLMYLAFAPALFLRANVLRYGAALAFLVYCSGISMAVVRAAAPGVYFLVMNYGNNPDYRSGVRIDFAVFSIFWYALPLLLARLVHHPFRERIRESTSVYLVMLLPFFAIGWGAYSNRYLLPAFLAMPLMLAATMCHGRLPVLRNPLLIRLGLLASCGVYYFYVTNVVII